MRVRGAGPGVPQTLRGTVGSASPSDPHPGPCAPAPWPQLCGASVSPSVKGHTKRACLGFQAFICIKRILTMPGPESVVSAL